jgi:hypothetical protein
MLDPPEGDGGVVVDPRQVELQQVGAARPGALLKEVMPIAGALQDIAVVAALHHIVAPADRDDVGPEARIDDVRAVPAVDQVVAALSEDAVDVASGMDRVVARTAAEADLGVGIQHRRRVRVARGGLEEAAGMQVLRDVAGIPEDDVPVVAAPDGVVVLDAGEQVLDDQQSPRPSG